MVQPNLLDCHDFIVDLIPRLVHHSIGALADLVDALVTLRLTTS